MRSALASSSGSDREDGVHVKMHIVKNQGAMNLVKPSLNDKPLRLIPSDTIYMMESDEAIDWLWRRGALPRWLIDLSPSGAFSSSSASKSCACTTP